jgi:HEAT repeat protein
LMRSFYLVALIAFAACTPSEEPRPKVFEFQLFEVVQTELDELKTALALSAIELSKSANIEAEVRGLVTFLSGAPNNLRESVFADLASHGDHAVPILAAILGATNSLDSERLAAIELLGRLDSVRSGAQLLNGVETGSPAWIRANSAWRLGEGTQAWIVPRLIHRLKYETDGEAVIWIAVTLAHFGNYSGVSGLRELCWSASDQNIRDSAVRELAALAVPFDRDELEALGGADDGTGLLWTWNHPGATSYSPTIPNDDRYRYEIWNLIDKLDAFQLRGVDDARFVLARMSSTAALCLARALHDNSPHTRVHSAQALKRMQARGHVAGPELVKALDLEDLAPSAADALGTVNHPDGAAAIETRLHPPTPLGLRVASAKALGFIGLAKSVDALRPLLVESQPFDLRQAAAESMTYCGAGDEVAALLCNLIKSKRVDPISSVNALGWWLNQSAQREVAGATETLAEWNQLVAPVGVVENSGQIAERDESRVALIRNFLEESK